MEPPKILQKELQRLGYKKEQNVADFWYANRTEIAKKVDRLFPNMMHKFDLQIRWESRIGKKCQEQLRIHIEEFQKKIKDEDDVEFKKGNYSRLGDPSVRTMDFGDFEFSIDGKTYNLDDSQKLFPTQQIHPKANLMGIDLHGLELHNICIKNASLAYANFVDSSFAQVWFDNVNMGGADLSGSLIAQIRPKETSLHQANLSGSFVNVLRMDDDMFSVEPVYKKVSYFFLLLALLKTLFSNKGFGEVSTDKRKHTVFLSNDPTKLTKHHLVRLKNYVAWYQHVLDNLRGYWELSFADRFMFSMSLILTKSWSSYAVLATHGLLVNIVFSLIYYFNSNCFNNLDGSYLSAFYFSIVTFTTLGFGDISPKAGYAQVIVIIEVLIGYITLGSFVFLIGHKSANRF